MSTKIILYHPRGYFFNYAAGTKTLVTFSFVKLFIIPTKPCEAHNPGRVPRLLPAAAQVFPVVSFCWFVHLTFPSWAELTRVFAARKPPGVEWAAHGTKGQLPLQVSARYATHPINALN